MEEVWKPVVGWEGLYEVSNLGRVKSVDRMSNAGRRGLSLLKGRVIAQHITPRGYVNVALYNKDVHKRVSVHRLVAISFISNPHCYQFVNHKDENPRNNSVDNLEWCTAKYNVNYGTAQKRKSMNCSKKIAMFSKDGHLIRDFESITNASRLMNVDKSNIVKCYKGKIKNAGGYIWKRI